MNKEVLELLGGLFPFIAVVTSIGVAGWVITTWLRIKHGYPLDGPGARRFIPRRMRK